ncbi:YCII-related domain protein [Caulifigura coniformis]|uniref:YCII-related domain protein n=1 Tax=Caulifigura coniformis TaxID=2527983 RepID=A0A517S9B5_9PLAN|nr:YciI family protein [Caulifigura coniformis]QDT52727.1 YCII-related domain protein [Caulifigura coniformis]
MQVMVLGKATRETEAGALPSERAWEEMERFHEELIKAGILVGGAGLKPSSAGVRVGYSGEGTTVTNGPFPETRELVAGYSIWEVTSIDEAIAWARRFPMPEGSEVEIRPIFMYSAEEVSEIMGQTQ